VQVWTRTGQRTRSEGCVEITTGRKASSTETNDGGGSPIVDGSTSTGGGSPTAGGSGSSVGGSSPTGTGSGTSPGGSGTSTGGSGTSTGTTDTPSQNLLRWAPPTLTNPETIFLQSGLDPDHLSLSTSEDYILVMPSGGIHGTVEIDGGHNVVLIGGSITVPSTANQTDNGADDTDTALYIRASTGTVHIEGLAITGDPDTEFDGIDINAPDATVQLENIRVSNAWGSYNSEHADIVQTWGGVKDLRIDDLSGDGDYQGLTIDPDLGPVGSVELQNVDLTLDPVPAALAASTVVGGYMMWLTTGTNTCDAPSEVTLDNVYVYDKSEAVPPSRTVWPGSTGNSLPCAGVMSEDNMSWPLLPVSGTVALTAPPAGPFVPAGSVGGSYVSPGYESDQ
jgi:hypothetical protein